MHAPTGHAYDNPRWGLSYPSRGPTGLPGGIKKKKKNYGGVLLGLISGVQV